MNRPQRIFALLSTQGTACAETVLHEEEYTPENRAEVERQSCGTGPDAPLPGTWTDVTDNEAIAES